MAVIRFNAALDKKPKFLKVFSEKSINTLINSVGICAALFVLSYRFKAINPKFEVPPIAYGAIVLVRLIEDLMLRGDAPYKFDSQFWRGKKTVTVGAIHDMRLSLEPEKVKVPKKLKGVGLPIENEFDLIAYVDYRLGQNPVGAYLVKVPGYYKVIFAWDCEAHCSSIDAQGASRLMDQVREGLKSLPEGETLTFCQGAWRKAAETKPVTGDTLKDVLNVWEHSRSSTQAMLGRRVEKTYRAYSSYTVGTIGSKANDVFDKLADNASMLLSTSVLPLIDSIFGKKKAKQQDGEDVSQILLDAYQLGYESRERMLCDQMSIKSVPLCCDAMWEIDYARFNDGAIPELPYRIIVTQEETYVEQVSTTHLLSKMFALGSPVLTDKRSVALPGRRKFVRGAFWDRDKKPLTEYKTEIDADNLKQLFFGSTFINDQADPSSNPSQYGVWDTEYIVQFLGQDQVAVQERLRKLEEENIWNRKVAARTDDENSRTRDKLKKSEEANNAIYDGAHGISVSVCALVYRDTPEDTDYAIASYCDNRPRKGYMFPESQYFPKIWKETLPFAGNPLLKDAEWDRRMSDYTSACASFVPLVLDSSVSKSGLEFQSVYGSSPFWVPTVSREDATRKITLGESGSGKSLLVTQGDIIEAFRKGIRTYILDATQGNTTTFGPVCDALGGVLFKPKTGYFNLMQGVDLRKITDKELYDFSYGLICDQWKQTITSLALGQRKDEGMKADYLELSTLFISNWFANEEIQDRYNAAYDAGFGSDGWKNIPTLIDYIRLAQFDLLPHRSQTDRNRKALQDYCSALATFAESTTGKHLCRPSEVDIDSPIVVVALGGINDMSEADVLPLVSMATALTTSAALTYQCVNVIFDELSHMARYDCVMTAAGGYASGGRKNGISFQGIGQDLASIEAGLNSSKLLDNIQHWQIGRVTSKATRALSHPITGIGVPQEILELVDQSSPKPRSFDCYSRWVIKSDGRIFVGRLSMSYFVLAISVNSPKENDERQEYLDMYPDDPLMGYIEYGKYLRSKTADATVL
jgi:hypothetical protein